MTKGPWRTSNQDGWQIVQVRFFGQATSRGYSYLVHPELGELKEKDWVWTPGNAHNPWGAPAGVTKIGSEYHGEMAVITQRLDKGYDPQKITVQRYSPEGR